MKKKILITALSIGILYIIPVRARETDLHKPWDVILQAYVKDGLVNYSGLKKNTVDMKKLDNYISLLGNTDVKSFSRQQKLAFWINAYNAFTVKLILNNFPVQSIKKIKDPWKNKIWKAAGEILSLDDIEHKKLRGELKEPRIHFAIVCASIGCPDLDNNAFFAGDVEKHLEERTKFFFTLKKNFYLKESGGKTVVSLSSILDWFKGDFGKDKKERIQYISKYVDKTIKEKLQKPETVKVKYINYDWSLNGE
jgi:hypothetical protein